MAEVANEDAPRHRPGDERTGSKCVEKSIKGIAGCLHDTADLLSESKPYVIRRVTK